MKNKEEHCHYSGLPSPSAYQRIDMDYDGMGDQGRFPSTNKTKKIKESDSVLTFLLIATVFLSAFFIITIYNQ